MDTERESITREVGSRIRYARKSRGMSMEALVQELMISKEDIRLMKHYNMFVMV